MDNFCSFRLYKNNFSYVKKQIYKWLFSLCHIIINLPKDSKWTSRKCLSCFFYWPRIINSLQIVPEIVSSRDYNWNHAESVCSGAGVKMSRGGDGGLSGDCSEVWGSRRDKEKTLVGKSKSMTKTLHELVMENLWFCRLTVTFTGLIYLVATCFLNLCTLTIYFVAMR